MAGSLIQDVGDAKQPVEEPTRMINRMLAFQWKAMQLQPSERATDYEFIRRASLDIIGRIATVDEIVAFENDASTDKWARLINRLLLSDEYVHNWAVIWSNWLMSPSGPPVYQVIECPQSEDGETIWKTNRYDHPQYRKQLTDWLEDEVFDKRHGCSYREMVVKLLTARGKTDESGAVNFILSHLGEPIPASEQMKNGKFEAIPIALRTLRLFLGYHFEGMLFDDVPNREWAQKDFWGVNACFRQVERVGEPLPITQKRNISCTVLTLLDNPNVNQDGTILYQRRDGKEVSVQPTFLGGRPIPHEGNRRQSLARAIVSDRQFPRAFVNRIWGHFFGRGFHRNPAVDDFGKHNPLIHPDLLDWLADYYAGRGGFEPRKLIRWICNSDAYQLTSVANSSNERSVSDPLFSRFLLKPMTSNQFFESLLTAITNGLNPKEVALRRQALQEKMKNGFDIQLHYPVSAMHALALMNGPDFNDVVCFPYGTVSHALDSKKRDPRKIMDDLFLATLNRPVGQKEYKIIVEKLKMKRPDRDPAAPWQDLFWALLNSNEFILNH